MRAAMGTTGLFWTLCGVAALTMGCVVQEASPAQGPGPGAQNASNGGDCKAQQDACVADCKAKAPEEASRQPCYEQCMRQSQRCRRP